MSKTNGKVNGRANGKANGKAFIKASKIGRPTKLTEELQKTVCDALRAGNYVETASAYAGISKDTLYAWLKKGARSKSGIYKKFSDAVKIAEASADVRDVATIAQHAQTNWQAAAWRLERKHPSQWGRKDRMEVAGDQSAPVIVQVVWPEDDADEAEW